MDYEHKIGILQRRLKDINSGNLDILEISNKAIIYCRNLLTEFKANIIKLSFKSVSEEITFFKETKQYPLSNLIYYFEIKSFEVQFPKGNLEEQKRYSLKKLGKLNKYYLLNIDFHQYIIQGKSYLDDRYFTRKHFDEFNITHAKYYFRDPEFSSSHDILLAKFKAYNKLIEYIEHRIVNLNKPKTTKKGFKPLNWTGSKVDMTELGYALKYHGSVNNGNSSVNEIIQQLEEVFNFSSGDPYKNYSEMRMRKKSRTKFLDELAIGLQTKMGNEDR